MARPKNEIKFCTVNDMIEIAKEKYDEVRNNMDINSFSYTDACRKKITSTLNAHIINTCDDEEKTSKKPHNNKIKVSKEIATFIVEDLLCDYFSGDPEKTRQKRKEWEDNRMEEIKKESQEKDRELNAIEEELYEAVPQITAKEAAEKKAEYEATIKKAAEKKGDDEKKAEEDEAARKEAAEKKAEEEKKFFKQFPHLSKEDRDTTTCCYHLPVISLFPESEDDKSNDRAFNVFIEHTIDRVMLRALFDVFYDFEETDFRRDLIKRSSLINLATYPTEFGDGYSGLTWMLERPLEYYISRKGISKKDTLRKPWFILDPGTEKQLKQYASEKGISVSKAIRDLISKQQLEDDKEDK